MRLTSSLWQQHIARTFNRHWHVQRKRKIIEMGTEEALSGKNIRIIDPKELFVKPLQIKNFVYEDPLIPRKLPLNNTHPDWKDTPCLCYKDHNVLLEGEKQAKILTKSVEIMEGLPERVNNLITEHDKEVEKLILRAVQNSTIYDAYQELLPKLKDPTRPAYVYPRQYGITDIRKIQNLSQKLIQLCESLSGPQVAFERNLIHDGVFSLPIEKDGNQLQFSLKADLLITSTNPLKKIADKNDAKDIELPDIHPIAPIITLERENIYTLKDLYPLDKSSQWMNAHTIFAHFDPEEVKNIYETPVTESQILGRSLLKSFAVAASCARQRFGNEIGSLPEPVTVQCIQSDGRLFHFSIFQLNTLDLNGSDGEKNMWWSSPRIELYEKAGYEKGIPVLKNYNPEVFKRIFAFYSNN